MSLLKDVLGMHVTYSKWKEVKNLPLYMTGNAEYTMAEIDDVPCIIMELKSDIPTLPAIKKQIKKIQDIERTPVVIKVKAMSAFRRKNMIEARIPFIIADEQAYLPFMGTVLNAKYVNSKDAPELENFKFSTQQLFLWYLYQEKRMAYISDAARVCSFSSMTMTRATRELAASGFIEVSKDGVKKVLNCNCTKKELFERVKKYLKSPVVTEGYLERKYLSKNMIPAGISALAERSMLNGDKLKTYAVLDSDFDKTKLIPELVDSEKQVKIELWSYAPLKFAKDRIADPISVALSLEKETDERVEMMIEEMLDELWEEIEW
ncbi:MarR family transcriptional regulator [Blautia schinkii]|nr:MarR family transcriptional regulator [Blautia schinkii]